MEKKKLINKPKMKRPSWSDLLVDLLILIMERLHYVDRIRFRAVCKGWRSETDKVKSENKLPWLMSWYWPGEDFGEPNSLRNEEDGSITSWCNLYDPIRKQKQTIFEYKEGAIFVGAEFCAAKDGWVLFSKREDMATGQTTLLFFYNPFTKRIIKLDRSYLKVSAATFTTTPDSPDCLIFTYTKYSTKTISIGTYSPSKKTWKRLYFAGNHGRIRSLIYIEGVFYCSFRRYGGGILGSFNLATQEWKTYRYPVGVVLGNMHLIEYDSKLVLAYRFWCYIRYKVGSVEHQKWQLYYFDNSVERNWCEIENLENGLLFWSVGLNNSMLVPVAEEMSDLRNSAHVFYTTLDCKSAFQSKEFAGQSCRKLYGWLGREENLVHKIWIYPPPLVRS
ncbi:hypothetical protein LWI29_023465 [Acer saccharum]|uniref:F-box domain-containing protein n=1 Tax=Acer saccharum TaxID=4024 RepID=A0AA39SZS3_ACESA|nr:hypothetical protein LWI29_023465 [Acer saccharum]